MHFLPSGDRVPYGYGKDKARVYYYDFDGKPNWVRKASPASFVSFNDGYFGRDEKFVLCGGVTLPKAKPEQWRKIGGFYSKDDARVYYLNRHIKQADYASFEVVPSDLLQVAKDRGYYYWNDQIVEQTEFEKLLRHEFT